MVSNTGYLWLQGVQSSTQAELLVALASALNAASCGSANAVRQPILCTSWRCHSSS